MPAADRSADRRVPLRNIERTRRSVLDAARRLLIAKGTSVTVANVAEEAGVSKSGLLHHFNSREQLLVAVLEDANERFRSDVMAQLNLSENQPGKVLRAYVRALCLAPMREDAYAVQFWAAMQSVEGAEQIVADDAEHWNRVLEADGLDPDLVRIIRRAAEGLAAAAAYGDEDPETLARTGERLVAMTYSPAPWAGSVEPGRSATH